MRDQTTVPARAGRTGEADAEQLLTLVTFDLGDQTLATDVAVVREILDRQAIAELPNAAPGLLGMIDIRGEGIAVMDLAMTLGLPRLPASEDDRIIVLDLAVGQDGARSGTPVAIVADRVRNVLEVSLAAIDPAPTVPGDWRSAAMTGVARLDGRLTYVIDLPKALGIDPGLPGADLDASPAWG